MRKKISSELKYVNNDVKVTIGTTDKKNPETVYVAFSAYITPNIEKTSYNEDIELFEHELKAKLKKVFKNKHNNDFIMIVDVANSRILYNKKSYLEIQIFFKTDNPKEKFKNISNELYDNFAINISNEIENNLTEKGFSFAVSSKSKK